MPSKFIGKIKSHTTTLLLALALIATQTSFAQSSGSELERFFSEIDKNGDLSGSVLVMEKGNILYQKSFGYADIKNKVPNSASTLFQLASVSKIFTSVAVLQLCEKKKLELKDKFSKYFPDFPYPEVTVGQLLSNTSGIPNIDEVFFRLRRMNPDTVFTLHDVIPALKSENLPLNFEPGRTWDYSNTNFVLAALLVEKVSGEPYENYLSKHIFKPAKMAAAFQKKSGESLSGKPGVAYNYAWPYVSSAIPSRVDSFVINYYRIQYQTLPSEGDGNVYASVSDLANFATALKKGDLLSPGSVKLLFSPSIRNNGKKVILRGVGSEIGEIGDFYWGLGNRISLDSSLGQVIWLSGGMPGCRTNVILNQSKDQVLVWLDNKESRSAMDNIFEAFNIITGRPAKVKKAKTHIANGYGQLLDKTGPDAAFAHLVQMVQDTMNYVSDENEMNELAYEFFNFNKPDLAFEVFRSAIFLFPNSDNLYNSYGELLVKASKKEEAIIMYKKSLSLNPENEDSKSALEQLEHK